MEIAIAYVSGSGHTRRLAQLIAEGAETDAGVEAGMIDVAALGPVSWEWLDRADAIVFGSPTYMGGAAATFRAFAEASSDRWAAQTWKDKIAAGFTVGSYPSGDQLSTLNQLAVLAAQHAMIWVGQAEIGAPVNADRVGVNASGSFLGLMATSSRDKDALVDPGDAQTARMFGMRIARITSRWVAAGM